MLFAAVLAAQNPLARPDPFVGVFSGDQVTLELKGSGGEYAGTLTVNGAGLPVTVKSAGANASGSFTANGQRYAFTLTPSARGLVLASDGTEYRLERQGAAPAPQSNASIVGYWRNASGYARFNADGTGVMDGTPGRYEIRGNELALIGQQGQVALQFELRGDVLTLMANGKSIALNRVKEEAGDGSIRPELVGKWCWISVTQAQKGGRQSSRCITLNVDGSYIYAGETDSYNPYGSATSQFSDAGSWTATETTLTARSRSGKTIVYQLEKRNHPQNRNDPMIVLNGDTFVTQYARQPW